MTSEKEFIQSVGRCAARHGVDDNRSDSFNENGTNITGWKYARLPEEGE